MNYFHEKLPDIGQKFVAVCSAGGNADLFVRIENDKTGALFLDADSEDTYDLDEQGYLFWLPLPDNFMLWFEGLEE